MQCCHNLDLKVGERFLKKKLSKVLLNIMHNIYNKLWLSEIQGIPCGPMGVQPRAYPVIMKPIINLFTTTGLSIKKAIINAYSSVEGTEKINNELLIIEHVENVYKNISFATNDIRNLVELMKLEMQ